MGFKAWNIKNLAISLNAVPLSGSGYGEDEVMALEWAEDQFTAFVGADGEVSRASTNNGMATVTLTYAHTAAANDRLTALLKIDMLTPNGAGAGMFSARDTQGRMVVQSERSWIMGYPGVTLGKTIQTVQWKIQLANALAGSFIGGR
jgi:hypothetical protein